MKGWKEPVRGEADVGRAVYRGYVSSPWQILKQRAIKNGDFHPRFY